MKDRKILLLIVVITIVLLVVASLVLYNEFSLDKVSNTEDDFAFDKLEETRENILENGDGETYYIAADGNSENGTTKENPMSIKTALNKVYHGNDKILFKSGDVFYSIIDFKVQTDDESYVYIGSYGEGEKPVISGANILINYEAWEKTEEIYELDLSAENNFYGIGNVGSEPYNIGFFSDENGNIYGNRKRNKEELLNEFDFCCEDNYVYIKCSRNPSEVLGDISFLARNNLLCLSSNIIVENLNIQYTGAHGIVKKRTGGNNVYIRKCVIENVGGSILRKDVFSRYGNAIEFWNNGNNIVIRECVIRNAYDAGFTIQGNDVNTDFKNILVHDNVFINNTYSLELFCRNDSSGNNKITVGYDNCVFDNNIFVNQGKGWGFDARTDKKIASEILIWNLVEDKTQMLFKNNKYYNSRRIYSFQDLEESENEYKNKLDINDNKFYLNKNTYLLNNLGNYNNINVLKEYKMDDRSEFRLISNVETDKISNPDILNSNDYDEIKAYYENLEIQFKYADVENEIIDKYNDKKDKYLNNKDIVISFDNILKKLENIRDGECIVTPEEVGGFIRNNYEIANNVLDRTGSELVEIVKDIDEIAKGYAKLFELNSVNSVDGIDGLNAKIDNTNALLYYYKDRIELSDLEKLVVLAVEHYAEDSVIGYFQSENIIDIVDKIINKRIDEYNLKSVSIEYSTNTFTNQDVVAKLVSASEDIEMPYGDTYTFDKNGMFAFKYVYKGEERELVATVDWIDKTYPEFVGINDRFDEMEPVTINVVDENLESVVATKDGQAIQFNNGDTLIEVGSYVVTATDKAGNTVIAEFRIVDYIESNKEYYISPDGNGDGLSKNSPMNVSDASKIRYYAGDKILFKSGERYNIDLNWYMMGAMEKNVTISSYDDGDMPVINGSIELVSNLNISGIRFTNSSESCLITNQMYNENIAVFDCVFENIDDTAIFLNKQVSNININNCIFRNCGKSGIAIKNDDKSFIAQNVLIRDNMFIGMDNMIAISGDFADESFENVQVCDNYFVNQKGDNAIISFGSIVDTKFDVKLFNNFYYNFEAGYSADKRYMEALKNNLVSENNTWYAVKNSRILNESVEFEKLHNDYNIENNSKFVVMNPLGYQISLIEVIASDSYDKNEVIAYILETIRMSSENKKVEDIDVETGAVTVTSGYDAFLGSKVGSGAELTEKNSQEKIEDVTIAEVDIPLAGWKRIAFGIVAIALVGAIVSGVKNAKYWKEENRR